MAIVLLPLATLAGIIPMLIAVTAIYWLDRYEREPWWLVALVFLWGAIGGTGFGCFCNSTIIAGVGGVFGPDTAEWVGPVIVAPIIEEVTKIIPLFVLMFLRHFDNATDGLIYGAAAGLGFAMTENIMYFYQVGASAGLAAMAYNIMIRTLFTAQVHFAASAAWGFVLGLARYRHPVLRWLIAPPLGNGDRITQ
ncbi:MAG: PrsW family intramembrane metalloprotease, partial [Myxococcota bacterium]